MLKQLRIIDLVQSIQDKIEKNTGLHCYDHIDDSISSPFYFVELVKKRPFHSKTMYCAVYTVWIHAIAEPDSSFVPLYGYIQKLEETMTEDIELPEPFQLVMQTDSSIQSIQTDETNKKHAILSYDFMVCYGFKCK